MNIRIGTGGEHSTHRFQRGFPDVGPDEHRWEKAWLVMCSVYLSLHLSLSLSLSFSCAAAVLDRAAAYEYSNTSTYLHYNACRHFLVAGHIIIRGVGREAAAWAGMLRSAASGRRQ
jgi:hypothetical protein